MTFTIKCGLWALIVTEVKLRPTFISFTFGTSGYLNIINSVFNERLLFFFFFADRNTKLGDVIDSYLNKKLELHDRSIHLLFSANRWEKVYVKYILYFFKNIKRSLTGKQ